MKLIVPRPLDRVLHRLMIWRLLIPLAAALLAIIAISIGVVWQSTVHQQESQARALALRVQDQVQAAQAVLSSAAGFALQADPQEAQKDLRLLRESTRTFEAFYRLDASGQVVFADPPGAAPAGQKLPGLPAGGKPAGGKPAGGNGELAQSEPRLSPQGEAVLYLALGTADGGRIAGMLNLRGIQSAAENGVSPGDLLGSVKILSPGGALVAGAQGGAAGMSAAQTPIRGGLSLDARTPGLLKLTTSAPIQPPGWTLVVESRVFDSLRGVMLGGLLALAVEILLAMGLVYSYDRQLRRSVVKPLALLNQRASRLAEGDFNDSVSFTTVTTSFYEVAELAGTFQRAQLAISQRQAALQSSEARFRDIAEMLPDMILELDINRQITFANRAVSRLIGYTARDFEEGMPLERLVLEPDRAGVENALLDITSGTGGQLLICRFQRRNQQALPVELSLAPMRDEQGALTGFRCAARDITERMKSEENLRRSFQLFTEGPVVVFRVQNGSPRRVEYVSPNIAQFGYRPEQFINSPDFFDEIIHPNDQARVQDESNNRALAGQEHYGQEYRLRCGDGRVRWVYAFTSVTRNGGGRPDYLDWYLMDITERKQSEERVEVQVQRLAALQMIGAFIENNAKIQFTLQTVLSRIIEMLRVDGAALLRYNSPSGELVYAVHDGFHIENTASYRFALGESYAGMVALNRKPLPVTAEASVLAAEFKLREMARERFTAYLGLPLIAKGELMGVLEIFHRSRLSYDDSDWKDFLETLAGQAAIALYNDDLILNLKKTNRQLIDGWVRALNMRDKETEEHSQRLQRWTEKMARRLGLSEAEVETAGIGALLHDIGKIRISDAILLKKGRLSAEEWEEMQQHPLYARNVLEGVESLRAAMDIPLYHHEKYDGSGYPHRLRGEEIPLVARVFTIADVWDAIRHNRPYREGNYTFEQAAEHLRAEKGRYFDPRLVDLFLEMIAEEDPDPEMESAPNA